MANDPQYRKRLLREANLASRLKHPGVVKVFEAGEEGDMVYIAMEYIAGKTLDEMVQQDGRLDPAKAVEMIFHVCPALQAAHDAGVLHRDIKAGDVMLDISGLKYVQVDIAGEILQWTEELREKDRAFQITCSHKAYDTFDRVGLTQVMDIRVGVA